MTDAGGKAAGAAFGTRPRWEPTKPRLRPLSLLAAWLISAASVYVAAAIVPDVDLKDFWGAFLVAAAIAVVNAFLPPLVASLRLPFMLVLGFVSVLLIDAVALLIADDAFPDVIEVASFGDALLASLVMAAVSIVLEVLAGTNEDDDYTLRVVKDTARRQGGAAPTATPGLLCLEIDGLALPVLRNAMRDGSAPTSPRRPARARQGSCSAPTRTSRPFAGWRRRPAR